MHDCKYYTELYKERAFVREREEDVKLRLVKLFFNIIDFLRSKEERKNCSK